MFYICFVPKKIDVEKVAILKQRALVYASQKKMQKAYDTFIEMIELENELWKYVMYSASRNRERSQKNISIF